MGARQTRAVRGPRPSAAAAVEVLYTRIPNLPTCLQTYYYYYYYYNVYALIHNMKYDLLIARRRNNPRAPRCTTIRSKLSTVGNNNNNNDI